MLEVAARTATANKQESASTSDGCIGVLRKWILCFSGKTSRHKTVTTFPLEEECLTDFRLSQRCIGKTTLQAVDETQPFVAECDASELAISTTLNQGGRPVAFMSQSLSGSELRYTTLRWRRRQRRSSRRKENGSIFWRDVVLVSRWSQIRYLSHLCLTIARERKSKQ